jgi:hypothetical protein
VEELQIVVNPVHLRPGLSSCSGDVEVLIEGLPAELFDETVIGRDPPGVDSNGSGQRFASSVRIPDVDIDAIASP